MHISLEGKFEKNLYINSISLKLILSRGKELYLWEQIYFVEIIFFLFPPDLNQLPNISVKCMCIVLNLKSFEIYMYIATTFFKNWYVCR